MEQDWKIIRYESSKAAEWDAFVKSARNATFLFERGYMDYHADRFVDCSWMAYKGGALRALLPANIDSGRILHSHGGLSYGGWIMPQSHFDGVDMLNVFKCACQEWKKEGIVALDYKPLPAIYAVRPSQEDIYALFRLGAELTEVNISSTINLRSPGKFNKQQRRHLASALRLPIEVAETGDIKAVMEMLEVCLRERHDTVPVHTAAEIELLKKRFPDNIKMYATFFEGKMHAAVCIYDTGVVAHAQYIATTARGRELNLLSPLLHWLITERYAQRDYFDFGISNEDHGRILNEGLLRQKCSYGATAVAFSRYMLRLSDNSD